MIAQITIPDLQSLLPPLLATLPTSFASSRPPPDLLSLLSPILRQRLQIHTSTPSTQHDSWLRLLCWDNQKAEELKDQLENANFEPHPVSGEIEIGEIDTIKYKRFDFETLKAQIALSDWNLTMIYLWCAGEEPPSWRLAELLPLDLDMISSSEWSESLEAAAAVHSQVSERTNLERKASIASNGDDYWAMYDSTPGRTPARHGSVNPPNASMTDDAYYQQYGDVQPAMDGHDPDEVVEEEAPPTALNGNILGELLAQTQRQPESDPNVLERENNVSVNHPVPSSPSSRAGSDTVARLEDSAQRHTASEVAIRQHISTTVKSMYRLAKATGMTRDDFEEMVQRELESLSIFDQDD